MRFVTSDLHFNHKNIVVYQPNRGTLDLNEMNEKIISNWNEDVKPEDEVFILGDVAMGIVVNSLPLIARLNGTKHLIRGNHDRTLTRLMTGDSAVRELFDMVEDYHTMVHAVDGLRHFLCMSHFPMAHWESQDKGSMMLHGHLHGSTCGITGRIKDVGMDTNHLRPYRLDDVVRELAKIAPKEHHHGR